MAEKGLINAESYGEFCQLMTKVAENQLDMHRETYYPICVSNTTLLVTKLVWQNRKTAMQR